MALNSGRCGVLFYFQIIGYIRILLQETPTNRNCCEKKQHIATESNIKQLSTATESNIIIPMSRDREP